MHRCIPQPGQAFHMVWFDLIYLYFVTLRQCFRDVITDVPPEFQGVPELKKSG